MNFYDKKVRRLVSIIIFGGYCCNGCNDGDSISGLRRV